MNDVKEQLQNLLKEANIFNYENFSVKSQYGYPESYSPEWFAWKCRVVNILTRTFKDDSAPVNLVKLSRQIRVIGNGEDKFIQAKSSMIKALESGVSNLENDMYGEIKRDENIQEDPLINLKSIISRFHLIAKQLRGRYSDRSTLDVNDEYDTQDLLHCLLRLFFADIRPEEYVPSYAGKNSKVDFLLKDAEIAIEVKKTREGLEEKEIGRQLIDDISRYKKHPNCKLLVCFIYDPDGRIVNPVGLERDLCENSGELDIEAPIQI
jgi:REase_DpnII-MboI